MTARTRELADALEALPLTRLSKKSAEALPGLLSDLRRPADHVSLPTEPGNVILDVTSVKGTHCALMRLRPDGTWAGDDDEGWFMPLDPENIALWTPARVLPGPEPETLAEAVADWCERHGWHMYTPGKVTPKREQVHITALGCIVRHFASGVVRDSGVAWVKPSDDRPLS